MKSNIVTATFVLLSLPVFAGTQAPVITPAPAPVDWSFRMALYGWAEGLDGDIGVLGKTASVDIPFSDIAKDLDMAFMGTFVISRDRWSFVADCCYADIGVDDQFRDISIDFKLQQFIGNFTVNYDAVRTDSMMLVLYAGARVNYLDATLELNDSRTPYRDFKKSDNMTWVDPIIGARFMANLSEKFYFMASGDVGGFGVSSQFTWQAMAGFGYRITENGSILLGYRAIGTDYTNGGFTYDLVSSGPVLGYEYKF